MSRKENSCIDSSDRSSYQENDPQVKVKVVKTLDEVLESIPVGFFHLRLALICGSAFMADAMEVSLLSYIAICAGDDWNLSDTQQATITSLVFAGALFGSLVWGRFADYYGRRKCFITACIVVSLAGILSALSPSYPWLLIFRGLVGFGIGGSTVPFDLLAEFLPVTHRGKFLIYIEYFWTFGTLFVNGVAWASLESLGWRFLTYITAIPVTLAFIFGFIYLPESPRWLLVMGRQDEAEAIITEAARVNGQELRPFSLHVDDKLCPAESDVFVELFRTKEIRNVTIPLGIVWLCFGLAYYGVILLVSRLYSTSDDDSTTCSFDYEYVFINACAELVGVTITGAIIDSVGRVRTQASLYLLGAMMMFILGFNLSTVAILIVAWFARLAAMGSSCATWVATPELFPTEIRASGHALSNSLARIGAFLIPYFVDSSINVLAVAFGLAAVNLVAAVTTTFLPETSGSRFA
jgi:MFS family permease